MRSPRPLPALLLVTALLVTGCGELEARLDGARATRSAVQAPPTVVDELAALNIAVAPLEVIQATPAATLEPTVDAEKAQLIANVDAMRESLDIMRREIDNNNAEIAASNAAAALANEQAQKWAAAQEATKLERDKELTAQKQKDNEKILAQVELDKAAALQKQADAAMVQMVCFVAIFVVLMLFAFRALTRYPAMVNQPKADADKWKHISKTSSVLAGSSADNGVHVDDVALSHYLEYALRGSFLGENNAIQALKSVVDKTDVKTITDYVGDNGYCSPRSLTLGGTANVLNQAGVAWALKELERINSTPAPLEDIAQTSTPTPYERAETHVFAEGEVVEQEKEAAK